MIAVCLAGCGCRCDGSGAENRTLKILQLNGLFGRLNKACLSYPCHLGLLLF